MTEDDLYANFDPSDGYRAVVVDHRPLAVAVYGELFAKGKSARKTYRDLPEAQLLYEARQAEDGRQFGGAQRAQFLADAVCRFFNTGGTADELVDLLRSMKPLLIGPMVLPDGYYLLETFLNTDNKHEHVFVSDTQDEAIVWVEDEMFQFLPWSAVAERLGDNGRIESADFFQQLGERREETLRLAGEVRDRPDSAGEGSAG